MRPAQEPTKVGEKEATKDGKEPEGAKVPEVVEAEIVARGGAQFPTLPLVRRVFFGSNSSYIAIF